MTLSTNIKNKIYNTIWVAIALVVIAMLVAAMQINNSTICKAVKVEITSNPNQQFLNEADILKMINASQIINSKKIQQIDTKQIEAQLQNNVWIDAVNVYFDKASVLHIQLAERQPLCRIFRANGNSFYIDKKCYQLPLSSDYSAVVPVFTGFSNNSITTLNDSSSLASIVIMANYINNNSFWMAQLQQINMVHTNEFELIPTIGNHTIIFGDTVALQQKFEKLYRYYKSVATKIGFDKYSILNVKFKNQVVASNTITNIDSINATQVIQNFMQTNSINADSTTNNAANDTTTTSGTVTEPKPNTVLRPPIPVLPKPPRAIMPKRAKPVTVIPPKPKPKPKPLVRPKPKQTN